MKEIVEYLLAGLIMLSFIPFFTFFVIPYYQIAARVGLSDLSAVALEKAREVFTVLYDQGNLTYAGTGDIDVIGEVVSRLEFTRIRDFNMRIKLVSLVEAVNLNSTHLVVSTRERGSVSVLLIDNRGLYRNASSSQPFLNESSMLYVYVLRPGDFGLTSFANIKLAAAVLETRTARGFNYWVNGTIDGYPMGKVEGGIEKLLMRPGYSPAGSINASIFYYYSSLGGGGFSVYNTSKYEIYVAITFYTGARRIEARMNDYYMYYNVTRRTDGLLELRLNQLVYEYSRTGINCGPNLTNCWLSDSSKTLIGGSSSSVDFRLYNGILLLLTNGTASLVIPLYPGHLTFGPEPPVSATRSSSYIRLGMFDYYLVVEVWPR